jgi:CRP-like cAMP-binding protein
MNFVATAGSEVPVQKKARAKGSLAQIPYFAELDADALASLERTVRQRDHGDGEDVLVEGEPCEGLYFVIEGQVRLVRSSPEGRQHVLRVLGPGATFNDIAVFDAGANADSAVAVGPTRVGLIPRNEMAALVGKHPEVGKAALKLLSARQRSLAGMVEDLALRDVTARVARLLLGCIGRQQHVIENADAACAHITHQEVASMVGSVREVVQRALKQLEHDGAIALERHRIRVRDPAKLERWVDAG